MTDETCNFIVDPRRVFKTRKNDTELGPAGSRYPINAGDRCGAPALVTKPGGIKRCAKHLRA
jgi:hypothetical protein